jgi:RNA polymerase sigma factor (sigma-70 family)
VRGQVRDIEVEPYEPDSVGAYLTRIGTTPLLTAEEEVELAKRIEAGVYARHLLEQDPARPDAADLAALVADGRAARDHMIRANLRLAVSIARRYAHRGSPLSDVVQDGNLGLIEAVARFDHARGYRFSTCATWWIRKAIQKGLETGRAVRLPAHVLTDLSALARAEQRAPGASDQALADEMGRSATKVAELKRLAEPCVSLDVMVGEGRHRTPLGDLTRGRRRVFLGGAQGASPSAERAKPT